MTDEFITRSEYESRHSELSARITAVESNFSSRVSAVEAKIDRVLDRLDSIKSDNNTALTAMKEELYKTKLSWWSLLISFAGGGGLVGIAQFFFHLIK
jgi:hypothetical protein